MISLIACVGKNREIGRQGDLCWRFKEDLRFFRDKTIGHKVVMGYNTYKSLGFKALPNRENYVLSRESLPNPDVITILPNEEAMLVSEMENSLEEWFVIGGGKVYRQFISIADRLYLTEVDSTCEEADTFFPEFDKKEFEAEELGRFEQGKFMLYEREI